MNEDTQLTADILIIDTHNTQLIFGSMMIDNTELIFFMKDDTQLKADLLINDTHDAELIFG